MKKMIAISCGVILIVLAGFVIYQNSHFDKSETSTREDYSMLKDGKVRLNTDQIEQIDKKLKENRCEMLGLFYPLIERKLDFQDFETRISSIRNYLHGQQLTGKIPNETDKIIWKDLGGMISYNMLIKIDCLEDYYQKLFGEKLDKQQLNPKDIYENNYYDTGGVPGGGCLSYTPVLNKIEYDNKKDIYTIFIVDVNGAPANYQNKKQLDDEEIEDNGLEDKLNYLKISFKWKDNQIMLQSSESSLS
jgi:hypothetical protein